MRADDLRAVLDGAGSDRAVLFGDGDGGNLAAVFAAMHPDRVLALVPYNAYARGRWAPDYPLGRSNEEAQEWRKEISEGWGTEEFARTFTQFSDPSHASIGFVRALSAEEASYDRVLATVMLTDVVGSTAKISELGDRGWRDLLERHHAIVRDDRPVSGRGDRHRGRRVPRDFRRSSPRRALRDGDHRGRENAGR